MILGLMLSVALAGAQCEQGSGSVSLGGPMPFPRTALKVFPVYGDKNQRFIDRTGQYVKSAFEATAKSGDSSTSKTVQSRFKIRKGVSEGLEAVDSNGRWGFIDGSGSFKIEAQYDDAGWFHEGVVAVRASGACQCSYIDKSGKPAVPGAFFGCGDFNQGVAKVEVTKGQWGFIDKTGKVFARFAASDEDSDHLLMSEGLAPAEDKAGNGFGFVDISGHFVIEPSFSDVEAFSEGLAAVSEDGGQLWGYIDKSGKYVIKPKFCAPDLEAHSDTSGFHEGLAFVCNPANGKFGFVDKQGRFVIPARFETCRTPEDEVCGFSGGLAWVEDDERVGYVNAKGAWVWSARRRSKGFSR